MEEAQATPALGTVLRHIHRFKPAVRSDHARSTPSILATSRETGHMVGQIVEKRPVPLRPDTVAWSCRLLIRVAVRMILPDIGTGVLHAKRRVAAFPYLKSEDTAIIAVLIIRDANRSGIIRLTFTA